ncbi:MAG: FG-GAP-like repeat-containing protein [Sedimentisphaeraceae bacterium JB056]
MSIISRLNLVTITVLLFTLDVFSLTYDSDFYSDVIVVQDTSAVLYESTGTDNFLAQISNISEPRVSVVVADFDKDNQVDLFLGSAGSAASWYESNSNDSSGWVGSLSNDALDMAVDDFDSDGFSDIFVLKSNGLLAWYENSGDNTLLWHSNPMGTGSGTNSIAIGDIDNDSVRDMLVCKSSIVRYKDNGNHGLTWVETINVGSLPSTIADSDIKIGDFDGDSYSDIFIVHTDGLQWYEYINGNLNAVGGRIGDSSVRCVSFGDIDDDGIVELLVGRKDNYVAWYENNGNDSLLSVTGVLFGYNAKDIASVPSYSSFVNILDKKVIYSSEEHVTFPNLQIAKSGKLIVGFNTGIHPVNEVYHGIISTDKCQTYQNMEPLAGTLAVNVLSGQAPAIILGFNTQAINSRIVRAYLSYAFDDWNVITKHTVDIEFPFDVDNQSFHSTILMLKTGTLLATMYGKASGSDYNSVYIVESTDFGESWNYKSTAAEKLSWMGEEGPTESSMVELRNGDLLLVTRTGDIGPPVEQPTTEVPMAYTISEDKGLNWSIPASLGVPGVDPDMILLGDGRVLLSYGRPGVHLMLADSSGTKWSQPFLVYGGPGGGYTGLRKASDDTLLLVYSESDFASWQSYTGDVNHLKMLEFKVSDACVSRAYQVGDLNLDCMCDSTDLTILADDWLR